MKTLLLVLFITACAQTPPKISTRVSEFTEEWSSDYSNGSQKLKSQYRNYLASVESLYEKTGNAHNFDSYLRSLMSNFQILMDRELNIAPIYRKKIIDRKNNSFESWKFFHLKDLREKLVNQRENKLKEQIGNETFKKLKDNHADFKRENPDADFHL